MLLLNATALMATLFMTTATAGAIHSTWPMPGCNHSALVMQVGCGENTFVMTPAGGSAQSAPDVRGDSPSPVPMTGCQDSDGGDFPNTAGYVIDAFGGGPFVDRCLADGVGIYEQVCNANGTAQAIQHTCAHGCGTTTITVPGYGNYVVAFCKP